jgi:glutamine amidotransferase-like uncharacterized protein
MKIQKLALAAALAALPILSACESPGAGIAENPGNSGGVALPPALSVPRASGVLLFAGAGTWGTEVAALERILDAHDVSYDEVSSAELESMTEEELASYALILWPGGAGGTQAGSLSGAARIRVREAVQKSGVSWLGFCAGAFVAVGPRPAAGSNPSYGLGILEGDYLDYYYLENQGVTAALTEYSFADGSSRDVLWYGGPVTPEIAGGVVARYPDGKPAITQAVSGQGFVILSAGHPAAPTSVASSFGLSDSDGADTELAWTLIRTAMERVPLPAR